MPNWQDLRYFHALVEGASLSAAARRLGVEHATIARRISALEADMGLRLVDRRGRRLVLTADGRAVGVIVAKMETEALAVERLTAAAALLDTEVSISAPPAYVRYELAPKFAALRKANPGLRLTVIGETRYAALDRREADIAIRLDRPADGDLTIRKIGEVRFNLYARADYIAGRAEADWEFIAYDEAMDNAAQQRWLMQRAGARGFALRASTLEMQAEFAARGCGVVLLPDFVAASFDTLEKVGGETTSLFVREVWLTVHSDLKNAPGIRVVTDALAQ